MKHGRVLVMFVVIVAFAPRLVHSQGTPEPGSSSKLWYGGNLNVSPLGSVKSSARGISITSDLDTTPIGIGGLLEFRVSPIFSIGFAPAVIFNVERSGATTLLDLPARLTLGGEVASKVRLYGFATPGYGHTVGFLSTERASGFVAGIGGGAGFRIAPDLVVTTEIGYQLRLLSATPEDDGQEFDLSLRFNHLTFAIGLVAPIDHLWRAAPRAGSRG